jgi:peptidoglycan hydrolase-like protein with peptidoglycan-binding domain
VREIEEKLVALKFDTGKVDGTFDAATGHAVMAFQKVTGMERSGKATPDVVAAIATAGEPGPMLPDGGGNRVEIDLKKQVLQLYKGGALVKVLSVSTGNNKRYCVEGDCDVAVTPGGSFKVNRRIRGLRVSRLGELYNPLYFNGGIAMHGSASVPAHPASHGCVRIPMNSSLWLFDNVPNGTPVYVLGGKKAPVPFNEQAPPASEEAPPPTSAPPTTAAPTTAAPTSSTVPPTTTTVAPETTTTTEATTTTSPAPTAPGSQP